MKLFTLVRLYGGCVEDVRLYDDEDMAKQRARAVLGEDFWDSERDHPDAEPQETYQEVYVYRVNQEKGSDGGWGTDEGVLTLLSAHK